MAPLTWREVSAPNFSSVNDAYRMSHAAMNNAVAGLQKAIGGFEDSAKDQNSARLMANAMQYQDSASAAEALRNGTMFSGVDMRYITPQALQYAGNQRGNQLQQENQMLRNDFQGIYNQGAAAGNERDAYGFGRTQLTDQRADRARELLPQVNDIMIRAAQMQEAGDSKGAAALIQSNLGLLRDANFTQGDVMKFYDDHFNRAGNARVDNQGRRAEYNQNQGFNYQHSAASLVDNATANNRGDYAAQRQAIENSDQPNEVKIRALQLLEAQNPYINPELSERELQDIQDGITPGQVDPATSDWQGMPYTAAQAAITPTIQEAEQQRIRQSNQEAMNRAASAVPESYGDSPRQQIGMMDTFSQQQPSSSIGSPQTPQEAIAQITNTGGVGNSPLPTSMLRALDRTEGGGGYDTLFGHRQRSGQFRGVDVSKMTIGQALNFSSGNGAYAQSVRNQIGKTATPMGRHQIVGTTLGNAAREMGLSPDTPFNAATQDAIAMHLAKKRVTGKSEAQAIAGLRSEWEGFKRVPYNEMRQIVADIRGSKVPSAKELASGNVSAYAPELPENVPVPTQRPEQRMLDEAMNNDTGNGGLSDISFNSRFGSGDGVTQNDIRNSVENASQNDRGNSVSDTTNRILSGSMSDTPDATVSGTVSQSSAEGITITPVNPATIRAEGRTASETGKTSRISRSLDAASGATIPTFVTQYAQNREKLYGTEDDPRNKGAPAWKEAAMNIPAFANKKEEVGESFDYVNRELAKQGLSIEPDMLMKLFEGASTRSTNFSEDAFAPVRRVFGNMDAGMPFKTSDILSQAKEIAQGGMQAPIKVNNARAAGPQETANIQSQIAQSNANIQKYSYQLEAERNKANPDRRLIQQLENRLSRERERVAAAQNRLLAQDAAMGLLRPKPQK